MNTAVSRFREIAKAHAEKVALVSDNETLTYRELSERATHIAGAIQSWFSSNVGRAVLPTDVIGIRADKCAEFYVSIFGILATGASYVPIDAETSIELQSQITSICCCRLVIGRDVQLKQINQAYLLSKPTSDHSSDASCTRTTAYQSIGTDICYTIFTSGSTGRPKGVMVRHANLLNLVDWTINEFSLGPGTKTLQYSTVNFDASIIDIFPTLLSGATLCIPTNQQRLSESALEDFCHRHQVNLAFLSPSLLAVLTPTRFAGIATLLTGGESCSSKVIGEWSQGRHFYNLYGPTECSVFVTYKRMEGNVSPSNIGRAISGVRLHILDENMRPARRGELCVAGSAVSAGYREDPASTRNRFIFLDDLDASVLYRTGDVVEIDVNGDLTFIGRLDRQVKVRGYRVELEEIEATLLALGCTEAAVTVSQQGALIAYIASEQALSTALIKEQLLSKLNSFKVPQHFVQLSALPHKSSGKIDYQSLPAFQADVVINPTPDFRPTSDEFWKIADLWSEELMLDRSILHPHSNFRDLGGTSINIVHLLSNFETIFGVTVNFIDFLNNPTIAFLSQSLIKKEYENANCT